MYLASYIGLLDQGPHTLADSFRQVAQGHREEADVFHICEQLATQCDRHREALAPVVARYGEARRASPSGCMPKGCRRRARATWGC